MKSIKKNRGVAGILFVGLLPVMVFIMAFSMQMSQQMMAHARILEAAEVASLALIASPKKDDDDNAEYARKLVDRYVVDNIEDIEVNVVNRKCEYKNGCVQKSGELAPFTDFIVSATSKHQSWISYEDIDLKPEFQVKGQSTTRKYLPQPVDVYFIGDFSGSMNDPWRDGKSKLEVVKDTIVRVIDDLKEFKTEDKSRVALLGYSYYHLKQTNEVVLVDKYGLKHSWPMRIAYNYRRNTARLTVQNMFTPPRVYQRTESPTNSMGYNALKELIDKNDEFFKKYPFYDIPLTEDYADFKEKLLDSKLKANWGTRSWNGIIAAAQEANKAKDLNPEQVFIVLSDGKDSGGGGYLQSLVDAGLCTKLRSKISSKKNRYQSDSSTPDDNEKTKVTMGVIGINYQVSASDGFGDCFGRENIYHAKDGDDVYKFILNLINEETGRLKD
ncbi:TadE/TadG family type IV pilus assembly protein [Vibrio sp. TRT 17S01]|uniref:TadE/TadG family type IV pilus assembly protein n=1 Tax=Vibrio sp. TRT 17S01 TaxID=3418505 RepID=UPI003CFA68BA